MNGITLCAKGSDGYRSSRQELAQYENSLVSICDQS